MTSMPTFLALCYGTGDTVTLSRCREVHFDFDFINHTRQVVSKKNLFHSLADQYHPPTGNTQLRSRPLVGVGVGVGSAQPVGQDLKGKSCITQIKWGICTFLILQYVAGMPRKMFSEGMPGQTDLTALQIGVPEAAWPFHLSHPP